MVGAGGAVPEGVAGGDDADVVADEREERGAVVGEGPVRELHHLDDAEGEEEGVRAVGVPRPDAGRRRRQELELLDEAALDGVDVLEEHQVQERRLPLLVHVHIEPPLHLHVAPATP